jgi:hypothetical protein
MTSLPASGMESLFADGAGDRVAGGLPACRWARREPGGVDGRWWGEQTDVLQKKGTATIGG